MAESREDMGDECQSTSSSSAGPRNRTKQAHSKGILARFKNNRARQDARVNRVDRLIRFIEKIQHETYIGRKEVIPKQLFPKDYIELLVEIDKRDQDFRDFFHHGLRYEYRQSIHGKEQFTVLRLSAFRITWSQSTAKLEARAMELIEEGAGRIRTVVGLNFFETWRIWNTIYDQIGDGRNPGRGPFSAFTWRAVFDSDGQQVFNANGRPKVQKNNYIFCDHAGTANPTERLQLSLRDFVPARVIKYEQWDKAKDLGDVKLEIDTSTMLGYFDAALKKQKHEDENSESKMVRMQQDTRRRKEEQAARRRAHAEQEHRQWDISNLIEIGGHRLRKVPGRA
ncbi:hypothetical protein NUW58_g1403 [Xylaria curta]|uniref:Uncharacterized protein n=1 Tax=Xylaria curta TaxID=42375 RepID=A0ACC1PLH7_9PEZI|nr:hypothetical protein NUW58_g1403 [Xylaria curta]